MREEKMADDSFVKTTKDALAEASDILQEPSRNTKRKILISINLILWSLSTSYAVLQLATVGHMSNPKRDNIMFPLSIVVHLSSAIYNIRALSRDTEGAGRWDAFSQWATVLILQVFCLANVHINPNTATSLLSDQTLAIITIFITGVILGPRVAVGWFLITTASLIVAVINRGTAFEYHLMTSAEVAKLKALQAEAPAEFRERLQSVIQERIVPLPVMLFGIISFILTLMTFLATYFEAGMIGQVLRAIPTAINKIQIAAKEKEQLAQENVRLGAELDVAQQIQAMILPREEELSQCTGLEIVAKMQPATEVGGDLYEVLSRPDGSTLLAIGDVTNHGLASGIVMLMSQTALRTCMEDEKLDLVRSLTSINSVIFKNVQTRMHDDRNLSLSLLLHKDGHIRLAGQHEKVILLRKETKSIEMLDTTDLGCSVGLIDDIAPMLGETTFELQHGDMMLLYTDGVTEAEDPGQVQFGEERLAESLVGACHLPSKEVVARIFDDLTKWIGTAPIYDDITLVFVRRTG
jgi:serine phosphatase RsbU (regulator of sigma subunit)